MTGGYSLAEGSRGTEVTYDLSVDLRVPMLGMLKRKAEKVIIDTALKGLKARVEGLRAQATARQAHSWTRTGKKARRDGAAARQRPDRRAPAMAGPLGGAQRDAGSWVTRSAPRWAAATRTGTYGRARPPTTRPRNASGARSAGPGAGSGNPAPACPRRVAAAADAVSVVLQDAAAAFESAVAAAGRQARPRDRATGHPARCGTRPRRPCRPAPRPRIVVPDPPAARPGAPETAAAGQSSHWRGGSVRRGCSHSRRRWRLQGRRWRTDGGWAERAR